MIKILSTLLTLAMASTSAHALTIDFEDADPTLIRSSQDPNACIADLSVTTNGFNFYNSGLCSAYTQYGTGDGPSIGLYFASTGTETEAAMTMTQVDGKHFDLLEFDALLGASRYMNVYGYRDGLQIYDEYVYIDCCNFFEHQVLNWTDLDTVVFYKNTSAPNSIGFDNLQVSVVPIPAAVWLFGSALGLMGWMRRKSPA